MNFTQETQETELTQQTALVVQQANAFLVESNETYQAAAEFLKTIKVRAKAVVEFFKDSKEKASAAHKAICENEKKLLTPLDTAERSLKLAMGKYQAQVEEERRRAEAEARRRQQEEAERQMQAAIEAEKQGDTFGAEMAMATAEIVSEMKPVYTVQAPKAQGVSTRMKWVADVVNDQAVPSYINGVCIRPVDTAALVKMAQLSNGTMAIPGVTFRQESIISVR